MSDRNKRTRSAFYFLCEKEATSQQFSLDEFVRETQWNPQTIKTYLSKKWRKFIIGPVDNRYRCNGICEMSLNNFIELQKQTLPD